MKNYKSSSNTSPINRTTLYTKTSITLLCSFFLSVPIAVHAYPETATRSLKNNFSIETTGTFFRPPNNPRPSSPGSIGTTARRTDICIGNQESIFALLTSESVVGQTVSAHPEFTWYLPPVDNNIPVIFQLLTKNSNGLSTAVHTQELPYTAGYTTYQLPTNAPKLTNNQEYEWEVIVNCEPNRPSRAIVLNGSIEKVAVSPTLSQALATATTAEEKALAYGQAGLWYDANRPSSQRH